MSRNIDEKCLIVRNFPTSFSEEDIRDFLQMFDPTDLNIFVSEHTAIAEFDNLDHAHNILTLLHQEILEENQLFVEYAPRNRSRLALLCSRANNSSPNIQQNKSRHREKTENDISKTLKRLYATADNLNFNQPPPPHLYYEYPKANRDIIDAICIALECVPKFYTQVLHLMNRMNLEPPFVPGDKRLAYESSHFKVQSVASSTQTEEINWQNFLRNKRKFVESDESELESSNSSDDDGTVDLNSFKSKRKKTTQTHSNKHELLKQKQKNLLKMQRLQKQLEPIDKSTAPQRIDDAFDLEQHHVKSSMIKIVVPEQLDTTQKPSEPIILESTTESLLRNDDNLESEKQFKGPHIWSDSELNENRIPTDQLRGHPMFQNYNAGEICNRLYIKNIAKEVTNADLQAVYDRYLEVNCGGHGNIRTIDIRLMTSGRMKGQAFITFDGPYLNCDVDDETTDHTLPSNKYQMIEKALRETNGLILKGKPLVVVYGKKK
ncbi:RNA-binding region-containing protein 3 isoform X2 [Sitodiplosis mosellana]|uniref:RNA-binding region-containing protein 3 isoform X2 n=1 Tax=Sitodiplosis mosellana TaxID=263140 RepID=UPI0024446B36|nr:RNA-binding region-containing protein 3 isoform X2 [Sitodiplosis mosellana]